MTATHIAAQIFSMGVELATLIGGLDVELGLIQVAYAREVERARACTKPAQRTSDDDVAGRADSLEAGDGAIGDQAGAVAFARAERDGFTLAVADDVEEGQAVEAKVLDGCGRG
jgi:hypothetical protein